jgi:hypothetical protein
VPGAAVAEVAAAVESTEIYIDSSSIRE